MDETYRMLGREHEADLEREAAKRRLAGQAREHRKNATSRDAAPRRSRSREPALRKGVLPWRALLLALRRRLSLPLSFLGSCLAAFAAAAVLAVPVALAHRVPQTTYADAIGDSGDAPDITLVTIRPERGRFVFEVKLAHPTELGPYGWILVGIDTDRNPFTGGGRGDELLLLTNGEQTTLARWIGGRFTADFVHDDVEAVLSSTALTFVLSRADVGARAFNFSVASLREDADLAPGGGVAAYPSHRPHKRIALRNDNRRHGSAMDETYRMLDTSTRISSAKLRSSSSRKRSADGRSRKRPPPLIGSAASTWPGRTFLVRASQKIGAPPLGAAQAERRST